MIRLKPNVAFLSIAMCVGLWGVLATPHRGWAQSDDAQPINPVAFVEMPRLDNPRLSPNGRYIIYQQSETDWSENERFDRYVLHDLQTGAILPTFEPAEEDEDFPTPVWLPDSRGFIVTLERNADDDDDEVWSEKEQAYHYDLGTTQLTRLTAHPTDVNSVQVTPDGRGFYFTARQERDAQTQTLLDEDFAIQPFEASLPDDLWFYDFETGTTTRTLMSDGHYLRGFSLSQDGRKVLHMRASGPLGDDRQGGDLFLWDTDTLMLQRVTHNDYAESRFALSPDNQSVAYIATVNADGETYYEDNLFIQTVGAVSPELLLPNMAMEILDYAWGPTADTLFILGNTGLRTQIYEYDVSDTSLTALTQGDHVVTDWRYNAETGQHSFIQVSASSPGTAMLLHADGHLQRVSKLHATLGDRFKLPQQSAFQWTARDGQAVEGLLVYPTDYEAGTPFPLITITHGGPRSSSQFGSWNMSRSVAVYAGQGYGVFLPNHRGGTGYGDDFMRDMVGGYFTNSHLDVLDGVDALVRAGLADPDQLIKQGWSAGGHMTNKLITFTDRFKVASSGAGVADWISMYGESDIRFNRTPWFGGSVWQENPPSDIYLDHSPLTYAANISTPTLFWNGQRDVRVPPTQGIMMYRAAKAAGVDTALYLAPGQPHGFRVPGYQLFKINTELAWYAKHLGQPIPAPDLPEAVITIVKADGAEPDPEVLQ